VGWGGAHLVACCRHELSGYGRTLRGDLDLSCMAHVIYRLSSGARVHAALPHCCCLPFRRRTQAV
jgi:hypothetical protein